MIRFSTALLAIAMALPACQKTEPAADAPAKGTATKAAATAKSAAGTAAAPTIDTHRCETTTLPRTADTVQLVEALELE